MCPGLLARANGSITLAGHVMPGDAVVDADGHSPRGNPGAQVDLSTAAPVSHGVVDTVSQDQCGRSFGNGFVKHTVGSTSRSTSTCLSRDTDGGRVGL